MRSKSIKKNEEKIARLLPLSYPTKCLGIFYAQFFTISHLILNISFNVLEIIFLATCDATGTVFLSIIRNTRKKIDVD